jgi:hypothetical protein
MTQFRPFTLGIVALFLFFISVSANKKELLKDIMTKMSLDEYCDFFKKSFCSLPNLDVVAIVMTTTDFDETCAAKLIEKAKNEYGIKKIFGGFNYGISGLSHTSVFRTYDEYGHPKYASQEDPKIFYTCSADVVFQNINLM